MSFLLSPSQSQCNESAESDWTVLYIPCSLFVHVIRRPFRILQSSSHEQLTAFISFNQALSSITEERLVEFQSC